ncbi:MAG: fatty acyl-AMP ligase [Pirellulaceae bacterium]
MDVPTDEHWQLKSIHNPLRLLPPAARPALTSVMVSHDNIMKNEYIIQLAFNHMTHRRPGVGVCWLPFHHDMGLMGCVLQSVFVDGPCYFMSPLQFLRKPVRWLQAISHLAPLTAYASGGPNFAFELCVRKVKEEHKATLDLSSWEIACVGAETVSPGTLERFTKAFAPCGFNPTAFFPSYGLAEATLLVTGGRHFEPPVIRNFVERLGRMTPTASERPGRQLVSSGRPWLYQEVVIVDPDSARECPPGRVGEIWISGPCVAKGYWNRPEETALTFKAFLEPDRRGPFLRTGDLGFFDDGELFISGRLKDLIIIRGRNYYPDDIECTVRKLHEAFAAGSTVALGCETDGEERLVILQEIDRGNRRLDKRQLTILIRQTIAEEHQLHAHDIRLLRRGALPKTTSGKVQRFASRELYATGQLLEWTEPENE